MANQISLGDRFYLFADDAFDSETDHLIISAHGGYSNLFGPLGSKSTKVPDWTQLHFYAGHGNSIIDPGIYDLMKGNHQTKETSGPGSRVTNYTLSKYQGRHGNADETYDSLKNNVRRNIDRLDYIDEQAALGTALDRNFGFRFHVLTVRNRRFKSDPRLSDALAALDRAGRRYENIHCSFCRSPIYGSSGSERAAQYGT